MSKKAVIDHDILGWGDEQAASLSKQYGGILKVGLHPDLPQRSFDDKLALYCRNNNCDMLTADKEAYTHYFEAGIKALKITKYDWWKKGDRPIYLIEIVD